MNSLGSHPGIPESKKNHPFKLSPAVSDWERSWEREGSRFNYSPGLAIDPVIVAIAPFHQRRFDIRDGKIPQIALQDRFLDIV